ncbi:MAG: TIGR04076 family protein [Theionarchaea archaeon]|nr:TIGR04076 family protein [Theionarchaea archaeon]MBU7036384.1 TIGR04076 family protein [Theionarchaea archaeon]
MPVEQVKITVVKRMHPSEVFENPPVTPAESLGACGILKDGQQFVSKGGAMPEGFPCTSAWITLFPSVRVLSFGGDMPWFKEKGISIVCCHDGLRPVIFKLEREKS